MTGSRASGGAFKASLFYYAGILLILVANFVCPQVLPGSGFALYASAFLAFATLYPKVQILLMFFLPVPVGLLGIIQGVLTVLMVVSSPALLPFVLLAYANYVFWAGIPALRGTARVIESAQRRGRFNAAKLPENEAFHTCAVCERNDVSHPALEFRVGRDGREYCAEHLKD